MLSLRRLFWISLSATLFQAALAAEKPRSLPEITVTESAWKVLFLPIQLETPQAENASLVQQIARGISQELAELKTHTLKEEERQWLREDAKTQVLFKEYETYNTLTADRDRLILSLDLERGQKLLTAEKQIRDQQKYIEDIQALSLEPVKAPSTLKIQIDDRSEKPYKPVDKLLGTSEFHLLIGGQARGVGNIIELTLEAFHADTKKQTEIWSGQVSPLNLEEAIVEIKGQIASLVLGRPWTAIEIRTGTSNGEPVNIYIDGEFRGQDTILMRALETETSYEVELIAKGLRDKQFLLKPKPLTVNLFEFQLDEVFEERYINLDASQTAEAYLGNRYLGQTPMELPVPPYTSLLVLTAPGQKSINYKIDPEQKNDLFFEFETAPSVSLKEQYEEKQRAFYWSSSLLLLSLAVPVIGFGHATANYDLARLNTGSIRQKYQEQSTLGSVIGFSGLALSGVFLTFNIIDLISYLTAAKSLSTIDYSPMEPKPGEVEVPAEKVPAEPEAKVPAEEISAELESPGATAEPKEEPLPPLQNAKDADFPS